ncbi:MAG TPA: ABC transporter permease [Bryobacteraceae bacterium]|nr:ABC transporter permease [Bryobacteraceae bacterium]
MANDDAAKAEPAQSVRDVQRFLPGVLPFAAVALTWLVLTHGTDIPEVFLPPIEKMPGVVWRMFAEEGILGDVLVSCGRVLAGFLCAVALATPVGILMGYSARAARLFDPIVGFVRYMPVPVFIPLCILWFGSGNTEKMVILFMGVFFQLVLMVKDAVTSVPTEFYEAATMLGAPRRDLILRVLWPAALPQIFNNYRICIGWAWTYLVVAEIVGANSGIGYYIIKAQRYLMVPQIFAAMVLIGVLGMATDFGMAALHGWLFPWEERNARAQGS